MSPRGSRKQLFIFRHGQTDWNKAGRIQGHLDVPLNELGRKQAFRLRAPFQRLGAEALLASDLGRAVETAEIIADGKLPVFTDQRLREIFLGKLQGLSRDEIIAQFGEEFSTRLRHTPLTDEDIVALGSESGAQVVGRATAALVEFFAQHDFERVAISTHGGVIRWILLSALAHGANVFPPPVPNGVIYPLEFDLKRKNFEIRRTMPWA